jgi:protein-L-isoaspartate(D-aspartate) O-methyltransferase
MNRCAMVVLMMAASFAGCCRCCNAGEPGEKVEQKLEPRLREQMVERQIAWRGVRDPRVLEAMRKVPRELFVPENLRKYAFDDGPLPIGEGQTISQPYIVALMTEQLDLAPGAKVLEIGTGSGYGAAVLAEIAAQVYTIEIIPELAERSKKLLNGLGYRNIHFRTGDGYSGWPEEAPFDGIVVTAAPPEVPRPLKEQLKTGARLVIPIGEGFQVMQTIRREADGRTVLLDSIPVRFVPMTGEAQRHHPGR